MSKSSKTIASACKQSLRKVTGSIERRSETSGATTSMEYRTLQTPHAVHNLR